MTDITARLVVVAGKHALPKSIQEEFITTGTVQVVVLSGYNITIIAETIILLLSALPKKLGIGLGAASIFLFSIAAGGSATIVRAVIMVMIALSAKLLKKKYDVGRALVVAGILMLFVNPMLLFFDPSFQLSFLATLGLIYVTPFVTRKILFVPEKFKLREVAASTIATQIFVTPFLMYLTGKVSLVALPANVILFFLIPLTMLLSFLTGILGLISFILAWPIALLAFLFLKTILTVVHVFALLPFASLTIPLFSFWLTVLCYLIFIVILMKFYKRSSHKTSHNM